MSVEKRPIDTAVVLSDAVNQGKVNVDVWAEANAAPPTPPPESYPTSRLNVAFKIGSNVVLWSFDNTQQGVFKVFETVDGVQTERASYPVP